MALKKWAAGCGPRIAAGGGGGGRDVTPAGPMPESAGSWLFLAESMSSTLCFVARPRSPPALQRERQEGWRELVCPPDPAAG
jgi:hypothetical protein